MTQMNTDILATEWERAQTGALEFIDNIPEEHLHYRPAPESLGFAEQYLHMAEVNYMFAASACGVENPNQIKGADKNEDLKASRAAMRGFVAASYAFMIESVRQLDPATLDEPVTFLRWTMPRHVVLAKALEHHAHHRGQTAVYFRINGLKPPAERLF